MNCKDHSLMPKPIGMTNSLLILGRFITKIASHSLRRFVIVPQSINV